jgi:hypothetical protein
MNLDHKHLAREAEHHVRKAQHHGAMADGIQKCTGMVKAAKSDLKQLDLDQLSELLDTFLEQHSAMNDEHADYAEHCAKCAQAAKEADDAEKTATDAMNKATNGTAPSALETAVRAAFLKMFGNTLQPSAVSGVAPTPPGLTAVPRTGAPQIPVAPNVPPEFAKLFSDDAEAPGMV